jgi:hypothetical protein
MRKLTKFALRFGTFCLLFTISAAGQITTHLVFETTFPFYAGNTKFPAGSYSVTPAFANDEGVVRIESSNGSHSAFIDIVPSTSEAAHAQTDVTFNKYGDVEYLSMLWIQGQNYGMQIVPTKAEQIARKATPAVRHSVPAKSGS